MSVEDETTQQAVDFFDALVKKIAVDICGEDRAPAVLQEFADHFLAAIRRDPDRPMVELLITTYFERANEP